MTDIEIARQATLQPIVHIAAQLGLKDDDIERYGHHKAKVRLEAIRHDQIDQSKLILVSAISPTPAGEGKTTMSIGLTEGLNRIGEQATVVLREPSLGPVFGIKGGATGGGHAQVLPMEDINLHFTGDFSAIEKAHNLLAAVIDNKLHHGGTPLLDPRTIAWKRVMDMNDRALRHVTVGQGGGTHGMTREAGFDITAASEIMAILCLTSGVEDLKERLGNIFVGYTYEKAPVYARDLNVVGAMALLLRDAIKPNLVQTMEGNPAIIHGGPFANIAQGTNSVLATKLAMSRSAYTITEAGFGFDLGAEKFLDIKCRTAGLKPRGIVLTATIRALKYHGGASLKELDAPDVEALRLGFPNMEKHLENAAKFSLPCIVALNRFHHDTDDEIDALRSAVEAMGHTFVVADVWAHGGAGAEDLARAVVEMADRTPKTFTPIYPLDATIEEKIERLAKEYYGADGVKYELQARRDLKRIKALGCEGFPICVAKTQKSLSDQPKLLGRPRGFHMKVREIEVAMGAGFVIPIMGSMMRMPGLPSIPASEGMDIDSDGQITGLA